MLNQRRQCKVCASANRAKYKWMRLEDKKSYEKLSKIAKIEYNEDISYGAFYRHFKHKHTARPKDYYKIIKSQPSWKPRLLISGDDEDTFTKGTEIEYITKRKRHYLGS